VSAALRTIGTRSAFKAITVECNQYVQVFGINKETYSSDAIFAYLVDVVGKLSRSLIIVSHISCTGTKGQCCSFIAKWPYGEVVVREPTCTGCTGTPCQIVK